MHSESAMNCPLDMETLVIISDLFLLTIAPVCKFVRLHLTFMVLMIMLLSARLQRDSRLMVYWRIGQS